MKSLCRTTLFLVLLCCGVVLWPISIYDPNDRIYTLLSEWEEKGYIDFLPMLRPYSPQLVTECLEKVIQRGGDIDRETARAYLSHIRAEGAVLAFSPSDASAVSIGFDTVFDGFASTASGGFGRPSLALSVSGRLAGSFIQFSGMTGLWLFDRKEADFIPHRSAVSVYFPHGGDAVLTLGATTYDVASLWKGGIFLGNATAYFQAGLMRSAFGPFFETSSVLGPQAPEAGCFAFTYRTGWITMSSVLLELAATQAVGSGTLMSGGATTVPYGEIYQLKGTTSFFPSKYMALHSAFVTPFPWLGFGLMQTSVFGARLDPLLLVPFGILADSQFWQGDWDNAFMGLFARIRPCSNLVANASLYVDDLNSNEALKLNFDSGQDKLALHAGVAWILPVPATVRLSAEYLMITPYTYSHFRDLFLNYLNYVNFDQHLGSILDPNSDQLIVRAQLQLNPMISGMLWLRLSRHGNGSDHGEGSVAGDGSIWDDGVAPDGTETYYGSSTFLTQKVLEKILQVGLRVETELRFVPVKASVLAEYTLEVVQNTGLERGKDTTTHYVKLSVRAGL